MPRTRIAACCARATTGHTAVLPSPAINSRRRIGHASSRGRQPQTTSRELAQECGPECLGLGGTYIHAENLTPAVAVDADCDDHGDRHDATVLAHLHIGRVDPQIQPVSFYGAGEEGFHLLVDLLAQP